MPRNTLSYTIAYTDKLEYHSGSMNTGKVQTLKYFEVRRCGSLVTSGNHVMASFLKEQDELQERNIKCPLLNGFIFTAVLILI